VAGRGSGRLGNQGNALPVRSDAYTIGKQARWKLRVSRAVPGLRPVQCTRSWKPNGSGLKLRTRAKPAPAPTAAAPKTPRPAEIGHPPNAGGVAYGESE